MVRYIISIRLVSAQPLCVQLLVCTIYIVMSILVQNTEPTQRWSPIKQHSSDQPEVNIDKGNKVMIGYIAK